MKKLLIINGPNINMLGIREPGIYGDQNYHNLIEIIEETCKKNGLFCECFQSNHEGAIVDKIQAAYGNFDGIIINPAAYTHTSIAILDALKAVGIPCGRSPYFRYLLPRGLPQDLLRRLSLRKNNSRPRPGRLSGSNRIF